MDTSETQTPTFDENESLKVIREMIQVSRKRLENNGILFIIWGWLMFVIYISDFLRNRLVLTYTVREIFRYAGLILIIAGIFYTVYAVFFKKKQVTTQIDKSLLYVWLSWFAARVLINLILFNELHEAEFALQNPIFMVLTAFALVVTAGILQYKLLFASGILFGAAAFACSYLPLESQQLVSAGTWLITFVIPGHLLYSKRRK